MSLAALSAQAEALRRRISQTWQAFECHEHSDACGSLYVTHPFLVCGMALELEDLAGALAVELLALETKLQAPTLDVWT